jgi:hypothetical protein
MKESRIAELEEALQRIGELAGQLPSGLDVDADENDTSPEDMTAHIGGLIWRTVQAVLLGDERCANLRKAIEKIRKG